MSQATLRSKRRSCCARVLFIFPVVFFGLSSWSRAAMAPLIPVLELHSPSGPRAVSWGAYGAGDNAPPAAYEDSGPDVADGDFLIIRSEGDLATTAGTTTVASDGTLGLRSDWGTAGLHIPGAGGSVVVSGHGVVRKEGTLGVGAIYNDGGRNSLGLDIQLDGSAGEGTSFGARGDRNGGLRLSGRISGSGSLEKRGSGLIVLTNTVNSWSGDTLLSAGVLRLLKRQALSTNSNLVLGGGILELGSGDLNIGLGTGAGQLRWTGDGGFSAHGGARSVKLNGGATLTWGAEYFVQEGAALLLSSRYADANVTLTNALQLVGDAAHEVRVARGEDSALATLSGRIRGTGGLLKTGHGLLQLTKGHNDYSGPTIIREGVLLGTISKKSNIHIDGGILGLDANLSAKIGTGAGEIRWGRGVGFAAYGKDREFQVLAGNGKKALLSWDSAVNLHFGHHTADGTLVWKTQTRLSTSEHTILLERGRASDRADVLWHGAIRTTGAVQVLNLVGNGRLDMAVANPALSIAQVNVFGAELRLHSAGELKGVQHFSVGNGGTIFVDNIGKNRADHGGSHLDDRIGNNTGISLAAGTLSYRGKAKMTGETLGVITLLSGANAIEFSAQARAGALHASSLWREERWRSTLSLTSTSLGLRLDISASGHAVNDVASADAIIPWASYDSGWARAVTSHSGQHFLGALDNYHSGAPSTWSASHNVKLQGGSAALGDADRAINSLVLGGSLSLGSQSLTLNAGALLGEGASSLSGALGSTLTTAQGRPLYAHIKGSISLSGALRLDGGMDLVKTSPGSLRLMSSATHRLGSLYIHQGSVELGAGQLSTSGRIIIGDGAGTDILRLAAGRLDQLQRSGGGAPSLTLNGNPHDPRGPEYGGDQAILQLGGYTRQHLANLHIENRGTIDWADGDAQQPNILWIDSLTFNNAEARLFLRNWLEHEDLLLVRRGGVELSQLHQVVFEGYPEYATGWIDYDANYIQVTPFSGAAPEPASYGAALAACGSGLAFLRRRLRGALPVGAALVGDRYLLL